MKNILRALLLTSAAIVTAQTADAQKLINGGIARTPSDEYPGHLKPQIVVVTPARDTLVAEVDPNGSAEMTFGYRELGDDKIKGDVLIDYAENHYYISQPDHDFSGRIPKATTSVNMVKYDKKRHGVIEWKNQ